VKRIARKSARATSSRSPKLPDELLPIVDAVVDVVFERLRSATTDQNVGKGAPLRRKTAKLNLPLPKQRTALAEALADLLLADLAKRARAGKPKPRTARTPASSRRGITPPKRRGRLK
jgi:hypothetical protein